jgi:hypothetical protein
MSEDDSVPSSTAAPVPDTDAATTGTTTSTTAAAAAEGDGDKPTLSKSQLKKLAKGKGVSMH